MSLRLIVTALEHAKHNLLLPLQIQHPPHPDSHTTQRPNPLLLSAQSKQHAAYDILTSSSSSSSSIPHNSSASLHLLSKALSVPAPKLIQSFLRLTSSLPN